MLTVLFANPPLSPWVPRSTILDLGSQVSKSDLVLVAVSSSSILGLLELRVNLGIPVLPRCGWDTFISIKEILNKGNYFYLKVFFPSHLIFGYLQAKHSEEQGGNIKGKRRFSEGWCLTNLVWVTEYLLSGTVRAWVVLWLNSIQPMFTEALPRVRHHDAPRWGRNMEAQSLKSHNRCPLGAQRGW